MKRSWIPRLVVSVAVLVVSTLALGREWTRVGAAVATTTSLRDCGEQRLFGYIRSLRKIGGSYELRFDPAFFLSGRTANQAAAQDGVIPKGQPVPNDNYVVNESRRTYLFDVTRTTRIRVLLKRGDYIKGSPIGVERLALLIRGKRTDELFESFQSGFWLGVHGDRVCSIRQQYRP
jgi:hypothetical protein